MMIYDDEVSMTPVDFEAVKDIAHRLRRELEAAKDDPPEYGNLWRFPEECCDLATELVLVAFDRRGIQGFGVMKGPRTDGTPIEQSGHWWAQSGDVVVDITADQLGDGFPRVIVGRGSEYHSSCGAVQVQGSIEHCRSYYEASRYYRHLLDRIQ